MKALSLWQPWASAITLGLKRIETRGWPTGHRGLLAIHAAKRWTLEEREDAAAFARAFGRPELASPPLGALIGTARLVDVRRTEDLVGGLSGMEEQLGNYAAGRSGWLLEDVRAFREPVPYRGMQGLFEVPREVLAQAMADAVPAG